MVFEQEVNIRSGKLKSALKSTETAIEQLSDSISLKASASDVYTKQQTQAILEVKANKDTLISEINASADQVKINADKININGVVTIGGLARTTDIPTNVSELNNDSGYTTTADIPTKVSDLTNDSNFATENQIPTNVSDLANDLNYATTSQVPTRVSQLSNDSEFQNSTQVNAAITQGLTVIDGSHITTGTIDASVVNVTNIKASEIKTGKVNATQIDSTNLHVNAANIDGTLTASQINAQGLSLGMSQITGLSNALSEKADTEDIPTNISDLTNDSGFQNATQVETAITGKGYQTSAQVETAITSKDYATNTAWSNEASVRATAVAEAAKTATDYLHFDSSNGLDIGSNTNMAKVNVKASRGVSIYDKNGAERNVIDENGMTVKNADGDVIANFGSDVVIGHIGTPEFWSTALKLSAYRMQGIAPWGNAWLDVGTLQDEEFYVEVKAHSSTNTYNLREFTNFTVVAMELLGVYDENNNALAYTENYNPITGSLQSITLTQTPTANSSLFFKLKYWDFESDGLSYFSFNDRKSGKKIAPWSVSLGKDSYASGEHSVAVGGESEAVGINSVALGHKTKAYGANQTVIGYENIPDYENKYAFIIGNGGLTNPFTVDWNGEVQCGNIKSGVITGQSVPANSYKDYLVTFDRAFNEVPIVVVGIRSDLTYANIGNISVATSSPSAGGFTARVFNGSSTARNVYVNWIATTSGKQ